jgi:CHRD domain
MSVKSVAALAIAVLMTAGAARASTVHFAATLTGADEVPANASAGTGKLSAELETDERTLVYRATYSGLSGPATMAHFHGPAASGANAPVQIPMSDPATPISGAIMLTRDQEDDLLAGKWYFNVHTKDHPGGEIRGQVMRQN